MLKKMRWHFILAAMLAVFIMLAVVLTGINGWNYYTTSKRADERIEEIYVFEARGSNSQPPQDNQAGPPSIPARPENHDPEAPYTTRFFVVRLDENRQVTDVSTDYIASVTTEEAGEYAQAVINGKNHKGYYKSYRYQILKEDNEDIVIFLNNTMELHSVKNVLLISCLVGVSCFLIVFLLVFLLSGKAMKPYLQNIERQKRFITDASHEIKTPLTSIAWEVAEPFSSLAKAQGKNYSQRIEENLTLCGNPDATRQMLSVLLDNAMKYSEEKGTIRLDVCQKRGKIRIEVFNTCVLEDTGNLSRLFDRFYRPDSSRSQKTGGSGIGLSIAQAVAEAYGGKIKVSSRDGKSILFQVII